MPALPSRASLLLTGALAACGGGGGADQAQVSWPYVAPSAGTVAVYAVSITDIAGSPIHYDERYAYAAGPTSDTLALNRTDLGAQVIVDGSPYGGYAYAEQFDASGALTTRALLAGSAPYSCSFSPAERPVAWPVSTNAGWNTAATAACTDGRVESYSFSGGSVVGVEDLNLAPGLFHTLHLRYVTVLGTNASALVRQIAIDRWVDLASGVDVRIRQTYSYSGAVPQTGLPTSASFDLTAFSKGS